MAAQGWNSEQVVKINDLVTGNSLMGQVQRFEVSNFRIG